MQAITPCDIERLRRRIHVAWDPLPGTRNGALRAEPAHACQPRPAERGQDGIEGTLRETPSGSFLLQEHFYANGRMHGSIPIERLQSISGSSLEDISGGAVPEIDVRRWAFLDTETTGLSGGTGTCVFLAGVGAIEADGFRVRLFFMRDYDEEAAMLHALAACLRSYDVLVTYNGKAYDSPLLETRYRLKRQANPLERMHHIDLLHAARRLWNARMPDCRLGTLESEILGVERRGDVPGALIPQRYFEYLRTGQATRLRPVFHHNVLDIVSLGCLSTILLAAYAAPHKTRLHHGSDLLGLARWLRRVGDDERALQLYRKAIQTGLSDNGLFRALWESAQLERKVGKRDAQLRLLRDLSRVGNMYRAAAFEELAKHYEHRERDYSRALEMTRSAQRYAPSQRLRHRENRLLRKAAVAARDRSA